MNIVFSYDCEGNWGFVDSDKAPFDASHTKPLEHAFSELVRLHLKYRIPATFAFVGLYVVPADERNRIVDEHLQDLLPKIPNLKAAGECWDGVANFEMVKATAQESALIEIGSHSLTHIPFNWLTQEQGEFEFTESQRILSEKGDGPLSAFIFPRNIFGYIDRCLTTFKTYRNTPASSNLVRGYELLRALTGIEPFNEKQLSDCIFFKAGIRRRFSDWGWKRFWRIRLARHKKYPINNQTVHVWSHPHNAVSDPSLLPRIEWLFQQLDSNRDRLNFLKLSQINPDGSPC